MPIHPNSLPTTKLILDRTTPRFRAWLKDETGAQIELVITGDITFDKTCFPPGEVLYIQTSIGVIATRNFKVIDSPPLPKLQACPYCGNAPTLMGPSPLGGQGMRCRAYCMCGITGPWGSSEEAIKAFNQIVIKKDDRVFVLSAPGFDDYQCTGLEAACDSVHCGKVQSDFHRDRIDSLAIGQSVRANFAFHVSVYGRDVTRIK